MAGKENLFSLIGEAVFNRLMKDGQKPAGPDSAMSQMAQMPQPQAPQMPQQQLPPWGGLPGNPGSPGYGQAPPQMPPQQYTGPVPDYVQASVYGDRPRYGGR